MNRIFVSIFLGVICFFLTIAICIQIKTVESSETVVAKTTTEAGIRDNILKYQEKYDETYKKLDNSNKRLENLIEDLSKDDNTDVDYSLELKKLNALLGYTDLEGQGIVVTVADGDVTTAKGAYGNYWVHDGDLQNIVNMLKAGGAEAVAINDERIVASTSITCAGNIIMINGKKVGSPFEIKAIGLPEKLYGTVTVTYDWLKRMEQDGVKVEVEKMEKEKIFIPKYNGVHSFNYAKNIQ